MSFLTSEEIWYAVPAEERLKIMCGLLPEHYSLHLVYRDVVEQACLREFNELHGSDRPN